MRYLITGGCGFFGSNLAAHLVSEAEGVMIFDNLARRGAEQNRTWLQSLGATQFIHGDIRNAHDVAELIRIGKPDVIYHLAGQVAMTTSVENPRRDFEINVVGSLNLLEAVRQYAPACTVVYSSSNKVYGDFVGMALREEESRYTAPGLPDGIDESAPLNFHTPYGCSKGAADQYMLDYARTFGLNTVVFRHSTIYGGRQFATFDQGWVGWFCQQALAVQAEPDREPFTISGDGKQVRDLLYVDDAVKCYVAASRHIDRARGQAFNLGGGMANSSSLLELFAQLEKKVGVALRYRQLPWRHDDQKLFVANNAKATATLNWRPLVTKDERVDRTLAWVKASMAR